MYLLEVGEPVCALRDFHDSSVDITRAIGLRHDVDDRGWDSMIAMAQWEKRHGYTSTYYLLHTAPYWAGHDFDWAVRQLHYLGHEVGIHNNALSIHHEFGLDPHDVLDSALTRLRATGVPILSTAAHGDDRCYVGRFVNYQMFEGHDTSGDWRCPTGVERRPLSDHGLEFSAEFLPRKQYLSDSGGEWSEDPILTRILHQNGGPTVVLQHPDWWPATVFNGP